jgi:hypothetical protein
MEWRHPDPGPDARRLIDNFAAMYPKAHELLTEYFAFYGTGHSRECSGDIDCDCYPTNDLGDATAALYRLAGDAKAWLRETETEDRPGKPEPAQGGNQ